MTVLIFIKMILKVYGHILVKTLGNESIGNFVDLYSVTLI